MRSKITRRQLDIFLEKHASQEKVIDIGAGGSSYGRFFPHRVSVDIDPARKPDIVADAHHLPFKDGSAAMVLSTDVCEHLRNPVQAVAEIKRILKKGGKVIFTTRFVFPIHDSPNDYWRFTKYGMKELFKDFEILELEAETVNFETIAILFQRLGYQTNLRFNKPMKFLLFLAAKILPRFNWFIKKEYGDIGRKTDETGILASGYYLVARKK